MSFNMSVTVSVLRVQKRFFKNSQVTEVICSFVEVFTICRFTGGFVRLKIQTQPWCDECMLEKKMQLQTLVRCFLNVPCLMSSLVVKQKYSFLHWVIYLDNGNS